MKVEGLESRNNGRAEVLGAFNPGAPVYLIATGVIPLLPPFLQEPNHTPPTVDGPRSYSTAGYNAPDFFLNHFNLVSGNLSYRITDNLQVKSISAYSWTNSGSPQ